MMPEKGSGIRIEREMQEYAVIQCYHIYYNIGAIGESRMERGEANLP